MLGHQLRFRGVQIPELVPVLEILRLFAVELRGGRGTAPHGHQIIFGGIDAYPVQPSIKSTVSAERRQCPVSLDECFLGNVLHFCGIAYEPGKQSSKLALVFCNEQLEGVLVSALRPLDQRLVNFTVAHLATFPEFSDY